MAGEPAEGAIARVCHPEFLARIPEERVLGLLSSMRAANGPCVEVSRIGPAQASGRHSATLRFENGTERRCEFAVDGDTPARIVFLLFPPG